MRLCVSLLLAVFVILGAVLFVSSQAQAAERQCLWMHPETNAWGGELRGGYRMGTLGDGPALAFGGWFFFKHFVGVVHGGAAILPEGSHFDFSLDFNARCGPLYGGGGFSLNWLPGAGGRPSTGVGLQVGLHIPSGLDWLWFDLGYRPQIIFRESENLVYHGVYMGLIFEAGR